MVYIAFVSRDEKQAGKCDGRKEVLKEIERERDAVPIVETVFREVINERTCDKRSCRDRRRELKTHTRI